MTMDKNVCGAKRLELSNCAGKAAARCQLYCFDTGTVFTSSRLVGEMTARYYATLVIACHGSSFQLRLGDSVETYQAAMIRPGVAHEVDAQAGQFALVRFNPLHPLFRRCCRIGGHGVARLDVSLFASLMPALMLAYEGTMTAEQGTSLFSRFRIALAHSLPAAKSDARITRVLHFLADNPNCTLDELGRSIGVSSCRMSHLFREAVGVCVKTYLCWQRMHRAFAQIENGQSLTQIAMGAGYSDLSHFGREFREFATMPLSRWLRQVTVRPIEYESPSPYEAHAEIVSAPHSSTRLAAAIHRAALRA